MGHEEQSREAFWMPQRVVSHNRLFTDQAVLLNGKDEFTNEATDKDLVDAYVKP